MSEQLYRISVKLSNLLDNAFGDEDVVKCRRLWFSCVSSLHCNAEYFVYVIGSQCDGCDTKGADLDFMRVLNNVYVEDTSRLKHNINAPLLAVTSPRSSYVNIQLNRPTHIRHVNEHTNVIYYERKLLLCSSFFLQNIKIKGTVDIDGPSSVTMVGNQSKDNVLAFKSYYWPNIAKEWTLRHRKYSWPNSKLVNFIEQKGCHYVPVGEYDSPYCHVEWRVSFVLSECVLVRSFNHVQFKVYNLLKLVKLHLQNVFKHPITRKSLISSYHMKTILFFVIENSPIRLWSNRNMIICFRMCLIYLRHFLLVKYLPHYFLPQCNLFKKLSGDEHETSGIVLEISKYISNPVILLLELVREFARNRYMKNEITRYMLYSCIHLYTTDIMQVCIRSMLDNIQLISEFEFIMIAKITFDIMYWQNNCNERCIQQKSVYTRNRKIKYRCLWRSHFDAASGWLQLSNLYYVTQQYNKTEQICMKVLPSLSSVVVLHGKCRDYSTLLRALENRHISEQEMVKQLTSTNIMLYANGLYPSELNIEVTNYPASTALEILPLPYAYFLLFLCAYHRQDAAAVQHAILGTLEALVYDEYYGLRPDDIFTFIIFQFVGICYELSGDKETAAFYYQKSINMKIIDNFPNPNTEAAYIRLQLLAMQRQ